MHDAFGVRRIQGIGNLNCPVQEFFDSERPVRDAMLEGLAFHLFHHDKQLAFKPANLMNGADVGMIQRRGGAGFAQETVVEVLIASSSGRNLRATKRLSLVSSAL